MTAGASKNKPPAALSQIDTEIVSPIAMLIGGSSAPDVKRAAKLSFGLATRVETTRWSTSTDVEQNLSFRPPLLDDFVCRGPARGAQEYPLNESAIREAKTRKTGFIVSQHSIKRESI
jgi:hypothetical protein